MSKQGIVFFSALVLISTVLFTEVPVFSASTGGGSEADKSQKTAQKSAYERGRKHIEDKQYREALSDFKTALKSDSRNPEALNMLGFTHRKLGNIKKSIDFYYRALSVNPDFPQAREYLGETLLLGAIKQLDELKKKGDSSQSEYQQLLDSFQKRYDELEILHLNSADTVSEKNGY